MHHLQTKQKLNISLDKAWEFFHRPENLNKITPKEMNFRILSSLPEKVYPGLIIRYKVSPLTGIPLSWVTEITQVRDKEFFIDNQLSGPYRVWHHQHHFRKVEGGVEMTDILHYQLPLGIIGKLMNSIFIGKKVKSIFSYREKVLEEMFNR